MQEKLKRSFLKAKSTKDKTNFYSDSLKVFISTLNEQQLQAMCNGYVSNWVKEEENRKQREEAEQAELKRKEEEAKNEVIPAVVNHSDESSNEHD